MKKMDDDGPGGDRREKRRATPRGLWAESTRRKQNEYAARARSKLSVNLDRETGEAFRELCDRRGVSVSGAIADLIRDALRAAGTGPQLSGDDSGGVQDGDDGGREG